jgi:hypothetical protein
MKRASVVDTPIRIFSDEKLDWMRTYSAVVDDDRWSMSVLVFCTSGIIQKLVRKVDPSKASQLVSDIVQSIEEWINGWQVERIVDFYGFTGNSRKVRCWRYHHHLFSLETIFNALPVLWGALLLDDIARKRKIHIILQRITPRCFIDDHYHQLPPCVQRWTPAVTPIISHNEQRWTTSQTIANIENEQTRMTKKNNHRHHFVDHRLASMYKWSIRTIPRRRNRRWQSQPTRNPRENEHVSSPFCVRDILDGSATRGYYLRWNPDGQIQASDKFQKWISIISTQEIFLHPAVVSSLLIKWHIILS